MEETLIIQDRRVVGSDQMGQQRWKRPSYLGYILKVESSEVLVVGSRMRH